MSESVTLVYHTIRFPNPALPNRPEFFGIDVAENIKKILSLGRMKLLPDAVMKGIFPDKTNPVKRLELVRSRTQAFMSGYTFEFCSGLARALPDTMLIAFNAMKEKQKADFESARNEYLGSYSTLVSESVKFWRERGPAIFKQNADFMEDAIRDGFPSYGDLSDGFLFNIVNFAIDAPSETTEVDTMERALIVEEKKKVAKNAGAQLKAAADQFKVDVVVALREKACKALTDFAESVNTGNWNQKSLNALSRMIDDIKKLDFMGDGELDDMLTTFRESHLKGLKAKALKTDGELQASIMEAVGSVTKRVADLAGQERSLLMDKILGNISKKVIVQKENPF